jgi:hypothetical protein
METFAVASVRNKPAPSDKALGVAVKRISGYTAIEYLIAVTILVLIGVRVLRFKYAAELRQWEDSLFESMGLGGAVHYLLIALIGGFLVYRVYARSRPRPPLE